MKKMSVIKEEKRLKKIERRKALVYGEVYPIVLEKCSLAIPLSIIFSIIYDRIYVDHKYDGLINVGHQNL